jgi:hypothetical protein
MTVIAAVTIIMFSRVTPPNNKDLYVISQSTLCRHLSLLWSYCCMLMQTNNCRPARVLSCAYDSKEYETLQRRQFHFSGREIK